MTLDSAVLLYTYISRFSVNPHHQQMRKIWQSCCHKFYPPAVPHCVFQLLSQMAHVRFHRRKWVLTRLRQQDRTQRPTRRNRGVSDGALSLPSERSARSQTSPGRVSERRTLPLLGLGRERSRRTQKAFGAAMRLCASLLRGVAAPLGCVIFFISDEIVACMTCSRNFFRFSRRSSLCCSCASCVSARSFSVLVFARKTTGDYFSRTPISARSWSRGLGFAIVLDLLF